MRFVFFSLYFIFSGVFAGSFFKKFSFFEEVARRSTLNAF